MSFTVLVEGDRVGTVGTPEGRCSVATCPEVVGTRPDHRFRPVVAVVRRFHDKEVIPAVTDHKTEGISSGLSPAVHICRDGKIFGRTDLRKYLAVYVPCLST